MVKFLCQKCKSSKLGYEKWVNCRIPVIIHQNEHIEYDKAIIDEDNELGASSRFICQDYGTPLSHRGCYLETEKDLIDLLTMDPDKRKQEEKEYQELLNEEARQEEQRQKDEFATYQTDE